MKIKLKVTTSRASRMEELVKASNFYTATKFPDRSPHMREPKKAEIFESWEKPVTVLR
ncbi:MAG: hypothetical protein V9E84_02035 [Trichococcus flocculiformis]